jgi:hypothetical protein
MFSRYSVGNTAKMGVSWNEVLLMNGKWIVNDCKCLIINELGGEKVWSVTQGRVNGGLKPSLKSAETQCGRGFQPPWILLHGIFALSTHSALTHSVIGHQSSLSHHSVSHHSVSHHSVISHQSSLSQRNVMAVIGVTLVGRSVSQSVSVKTLHSVHIHTLTSVRVRVWCASVCAMRVCVCVYAMRVRVYTHVQFSCACACLYARVKKPKSLLIFGEMRPPHLDFKSFFSYRPLAPNHGIVPTLHISK